MGPILYLLTVFAVFVCAVPVTVQTRDSVGVSAALLAKFELFVQYSSTAYCYNAVLDAGTIDCSLNGGVCPLVEAAGATVYLPMSDVGVSQTNGYVAVDDTNEAIIVAIRGTHGIVNILSDAFLLRSPTDLCGTANTLDWCLVHDGFMAAANDVKGRVETAVNELLALHPTYKVVCTGHSLGAAVAALLATMLRNAGNVVDLYTYGMPHISSADLALYITSQAPLLGSNYRLTHYNDLIPQIPEHADITGDWDHPSPEYFINVPGNATVAMGDIEVFDGLLYQDKGNERFSSGVILTDYAVEGISAHGWYFFDMYTCSSDKP